MIGAGPGDPGLFTIKGLEYIKKADLIVYDRLASKDILDFAKPECEFIFVGKENHNHVMKQDEINELLAQKSLKYNLVVRLKGGDPYVFGRGGEEAVYLKERGIDVEVIPGVSSCIAVLEDAGIPITHRGISKGFQVLTAHSSKDALSDIDYSLLLDDTITYVFLMGLSHVSEIADGLIKAGRDKNTKIAVISNGTTPKQKKVVGKLSDISEKISKAGLSSPAIIVVGEVVGLSSELSFFEKQPLFGTTCLVPYIWGYKFSFADGSSVIKDNRLGRLLKEKGSDVISLQVGKIEPIEIKDNFLPDNIGQDDKWLVYTSANAIYSFMYNLDAAGLDLRALNGYKIAVVGKKTSKVLSEFSLKADLVSASGNVRGLGEELLSILNTNDKVYVYSAKQYEEGLEEILASKCILKRFAVYENKEVKITDGIYDTDVALFTSASSVRRTIPFVNTEILSNVISIGPSCSKAIEDAGISDYIEISKPAYEDMVEAVVKLY